MCVMVSNLEPAGEARYLSHFLLQTELQRIFSLLLCRAFRNNKEQLLMGIYLAATGVPLISGPSAGWLLFSVDPDSSL